MTGGSDVRYIRQSYLLDFRLLYKLQHVVHVVALVPAESRPRILRIHSKASALIGHTWFIDQGPSGGRWCFFAFQGSHAACHSVHAPQVMSQDYEWE
jgi:hypothetical protein